MSTMKELTVFDASISISGCDAISHSLSAEDMFFLSTPVMRKALSDRLRYSSLSVIALPAYTIHCTALLITTGYTASNIPHGQYPQNGFWVLIAFAFASDLQLIHSSYPLCVLFAALQKSQKCILFRGDIFSFSFVSKPATS